MSLRVFRYAALALAVVGVGFLVLMARHRELPVLKVQTITPLMNFAQVRIVGTVPGQANLKPGAKGLDYIGFTLEDGTGSIRVAAYGRTAQDILGQGLLPAKGDTLDVAGSLRVPESGDRRLVVQDARQLRILARGQGSGGGIQGSGFGVQGGPQLDVER